MESPPPVKRREAMAGELLRSASTLAELVHELRVRKRDRATEFEPEHNRLHTKAVSAAVKRKPSLAQESSPSFDCGYIANQSGECAQSECREIGVYIIDERSASLYSHRGGVFPMMIKFIAIIGAFALANATWAANLASDDAADPAYSGGWTNGSNGGFGFGAWHLTNFGINSFHFISDSTFNGDSLDDGNVGGAAGDGDINVSLANPVAWGLFGGFGSIAQAYRMFTGGPLSIGEVFSVYFDNENQFMGVAGVALIDAFSNSVMQVAYFGGLTNAYMYLDASTSGFITTGLDYGDEGLRLMSA